jgi:hypothetical protein
MQKQRKWKVYANGRLVTEVYYDLDCNAEYVRQTLINHDGLPSNIVVRPI